MNVFLKVTLLNSVTASSSQYYNQVPDMTGHIIRYHHLDNQLCYFSLSFCPFCPDNLDTVVVRTFWKDLIRPTTFTVLKVKVRTSLDKEAGKGGWE